MKKTENNTDSRHGGSIPLTRYARRKSSGVEKNVEKPRHYHQFFYGGRTRSRHESTVALSIIRRVKWAIRPPTIIWPVFFAVMLVFTVAAAPSSRHAHAGDGATYARAVNVTLDTVMWVHEQHRGKITWSELNTEVCRAMKVKRTEPWQKR